MPGSRAPLRWGSRCGARSLAPDRARGGAAGRSRREADDLPVATAPVLLERVDAEEAHVGVGLRAGAVGAEPGVALLRHLVIDRRGAGVLARGEVEHREHLALVRLPAGHPR